MAAQTGLPEKMSCEHTLKESGGVSQTNTLGKRVTDGGNSHSEGLRLECARRFRKQQGVQGGFHGGGAGHSGEGRSGREGEPLSLLPHSSLRALLPPTSPLRPRWSLYLGALPSNAWLLPSLEVSAEMPSRS